MRLPDPAGEPELCTTRSGYRHAIVSSSLDILEHFFDYTPRRLFSATVEDLLELREMVADYFDRWTSPSLAAGETRLHLNLRPFRGFIPGHLPSAAVSYEQSDLDTFYDKSDAKVVHELRRVCSGPLLYADRVVDLDPLAFWAHERKETPDRIMSIGLLAGAWDAMRRITPLLDSGALVLSPIPGDAEMARLYEQFALLHGPSTTDRTLYDGLALLTAQRTDATVPTLQWSDVEHLTTVISGERTSARDQSILEALRVIDLPILTDIPVATFADIRESETAFVAWRAELRMMSRLLPQASADPDVFRREARALFEDAFVPRVEEIRRTISKSQSLRDAATEQPLRTALGAIAAGSVAAAAGGSIGVALASTGATGLAQLLAAAALPRTPSGTSAVIVKLLNSHRGEPSH